MDDRAVPPDRPGGVARVDVVGLGPGGLDRTDPATIGLLLDEGRRVVLRTLEHPAAAEIAARRPVEACDDLYETAASFADVYAAIARRVLDGSGPVVYAVPGSPLVGELAVADIRRLAAGAGVPVTVHPAESFLDAVWAEVGVDPLRDGFAVLDGHGLPRTLAFPVPTVIAHLDLPEALADVLSRLDRVLPDDAEVVLLAGLGSDDAVVAAGRPLDLDPAAAGPRTSLYVPPVPSGLAGAVETMARLRAECPWDAEQTHHSLARHLVEETFEAVDALAALPAGGAPDWAAYADVEEELGDVLLQVLFHSAIAAEVGAFDVDDVASELRRKLVRRHPHVFGDVTVDGPEQVRENWERIKSEEKGGPSSSLLDGVPAGMPALARAVEVQRRARKVGFDWDSPAQVAAKVGEELAEVAAAGPAETEDELGDLLFAAVNLARHLDVDPEVALRRAVHRFEARFRSMEAAGPLAGLTPAELDALWEEAKAAERRIPESP